MMFTRREIVLGGSLTILMPSFPCRGAAGLLASNSQGCLLAKSDFEKIYTERVREETFIAGRDPIIANSGDREFDLALAQTLAKISEHFEVLPGFAFYDDTQRGENAYATQEARMNRIDGTVLYGLGLFKRMRGFDESPEVAIAGVCSHEFGHILQFKHDLIDVVNAGQPTVKRSELQADYFAGYYAGLRKRELQNYPAAVVALTQHEFGDTLFGDPQHHGTPEERGAAVVKGFQAAYIDRVSLSDAISESTAYVLSL
jgi:hypothetical protein